MAIFLFAVGVLLVVLEVFIPSFGLLTLCAITCFAISVWQAYQASGAAAAWTMGTIAPVLALVILYFGLKYIPRTSWGRGLVLRYPTDEGARVPASSSETAYLTPDGGTVEQEARELVGKQGVAQTHLRPAGVVLIEGRRLDVVTEGARVDAGARVKVVAVEGNRIVVRPVKV